LHVEGRVLLASTGFTLSGGLSTMVSHWR